MTLMLEYKGLGVGLRSIFKPYELDPQTASFSAPWHPKQSQPSVHPTPRRRASGRSTSTRKPASSLRWPAWRKPIDICRALRGVCRPSPEPARYSAQLRGPDRRKLPRASVPPPLLPDQLRARSRRTHAPPWRRESEAGSNAAAAHPERRVRSTHRVAACYMPDPIPPSDAAPRPRRGSSVRPWQPRRPAADPPPAHFLEHSRAAPHRLPQLVHPESSDDGSGGDSGVFLWEHPPGDELHSTLAPLVAESGALAHPQER